MITKKTKVFGIVSLLFFLVSSISVFVMERTIRAEGVALLQQATSVADFNARNQAYRELSVLVDTTQKDRDELHSYIFTEEKTIDFLTITEQIAAEQHVDITTNSLKVIDEKGLFNTLVISFNLEGTQYNVDTLLHIFESMPYQANISTLSLQSNTKNNIDGVVAVITLSISLIQYDG